MRHQEEYKPLVKNGIWFYQCNCSKEISCGIVVQSDSMEQSINDAVMRSKEIFYKCPNSFYGLCHKKYSASFIKHNGTLILQNKELTQ